jgi:succinoglycan biosynthesis protein ExoA
LTVLVRNYCFMKSKYTTGIGVGGRNITPENAPHFIKAVEIVLDTYLGSFSSIQGRQLEHSQLVPHVPLVNALYEKEKIIKIGGFDESLLSEAEDAEINYRLSNAGFRFLYVPESFVWHKMRSSPKSWFKNMFRYGKGRARLLKRYPKMWRISYMLPLVFLTAIFSTLLSIFSKVFLLPLLYFPGLIIFSLYLVIKKKSPHLWFRVFFIFIIQHFGYSLGEIFGLLHPRVK